MYSTTKTFALFVFMAALALPGCEKKEPVAEGKGPAERAGQQIDQATARAREELNNVAEKTGKGLQDLGQKIQNEAQKTQDAQKKE